MKMIRAGRVQHRAAVIVAGDPLQAEQRLTVRPALTLLQAPLVRQKRRALHDGLCMKNSENADNPMSASV